MLPFLVFLLFIPCLGKVTKGYLSTKQYYPPQMLLLYYDTSDQWPRAYNEMTTCHERVEILTNHSENNQIIHLSPFSEYMDGQGKCRIDVDSVNSTWFVCYGTRIFRSARSRWWYLALANCDPDSDVEEDFNVTSSSSMGLYAEYSLLMTNSHQDDFFRYHFSDDEWMMLPTNIIFSGMNGLLLITSIVSGIVLKSRRHYHNTFQLFTYSLMMELLGLILLLCEGSFYAIGGRITTALKIGGLVCRAIAQLYFILTCMILARGLNVTKMILTMPDKLFLVAMGTIFFISFILMHSYVLFYYDPAHQLSYDDSVAGYMLAGWRVVAWLYFLYGCCTTRASSPNKKGFFTFFAILMTPWFLATPTTKFLCTLYLDNWVRAEIEHLIDCSIVVYGYVVFLIISRPTEGNSNFPYHIRTTQVDHGIDPNTVYVTSDNEQAEGQGNSGTENSLNRRNKQIKNVEPRPESENS